MLIERRVFMEKILREEEILEYCTLVKYVIAKDCNYPLLA